MAFQGSLVSCLVFYSLVVWVEGGGGRSEAHTGILHREGRTLILVRGTH